MDNFKKVRTYSVETATVIVTKGEVISCSFGKRKALREFGDFYHLLYNAFIELWIRSPRKFEAMYKNLYLSSKEYKIATKVMENFKKE